MTKHICRTTLSLWAAILCTVVLVEASASQHDLPAAVLTTLA